MEGLKWKSDRVGQWIPEPVDLVRTYERRDFDDTRVKGCALYGKRGTGIYLSE